MAVFTPCSRRAGRKRVLHIPLCHNTFIIHLLPSARELIHQKFFFIIAAARGEGEGCKHRKRESQNRIHEFLLWLIQLVAVDIRLYGTLYLGPLGLVGYQFVNGNQVVLLQVGQRKVAFIFA